MSIPPVHRTQPSGDRNPWRTIPPQPKLSKSAKQFEQLLADAIRESLNGFVGKPNDEHTRKTIAAAMKQKRSDGQ